ncbi:MAG: phosphatase PAP2 family protein [Calditrichia bacterium]
MSIALKSSEFISKFFRNLRIRWSYFKIYDKNLVIYWGLLIILLLFFGNNVPMGNGMILINISAISLMFIFIPWVSTRSSRIWHFIRHGYIIAALPFLYWQVGPLLHLVCFREFDPWIIQMETWAFGTIPNLWLQQFHTPLLTEFMQISYSIYWITIPLGGAIFYFSKQYRHYEQLLHYVTLTFFLSYFIFIFFPVAGPRFFIAEQITASYKGLFLTDFLRNFMKQAGFRGGAFPSSHVGVAVTIFIFVLRFKPKIGLLVFLPLVTALSLATVYGQYHYVSDVTAGLFMGAIIGYFGSKRAQHQIARSTG